MIQLQVNGISFVFHIKTFSTERVRSKCIISALAKKRCAYYDSLRLFVSKRTSPPRIKISSFQVLVLFVQEVMTLFIK